MATPEKPTDDQASVASVTKSVCQSCQSTWKPSRRDLIHAAGAVAVGALIATTATASSASTPPAGGAKSMGMIPVGIGGGGGGLIPGMSCGERRDQCLADSETQRDICGEQAQDYIQIAECIAANTARIAGCEAAFIACLAEPVVDAIAEALIEAAELIIIGVVVIGEIVVIGGIIVLFIACVMATDGICAVVLLA